MKVQETTTNHACSCGCSLEWLDASGYSRTMQCPTCKRCTLIVEHSKFKLYIGLADFHVKRGDGESQRPLSELGMASRLVECLVHDEWPGPATIMDYGIDSSEHFGALRHAIREGVTAYDLDRTRGDGPATTQLVLGVPGQPFQFVRFRTVWDDYRKYVDGC